MGKFLAIGLSVLLFTSPVMAGSRVKIYDENSHYRGKIEKGKIYDENSRYRGKIEKDGKIYDENSRYKGKLQKEGKKSKYYDDDCD